MKKFLLPLLVCALVVPCAVMLTACGGNLFGKSNDKNSNYNTLTKAYGSDNRSSISEYENYAHYTFHPTIMNQLPFKQAEMDIDTSPDKFYSYSTDSQSTLNSNGYFTIYSENKEHRISFSFTLYQEDSVNTRANLNVTYSFNNSAESNSRSINQIVCHSDSLKITITKSNISLAFGETKLELSYAALSDTAIANSSNLYYSTNPTATGTFIDYTLTY